MRENDSSGPLGGITVIEMGQLIAGPFCGQMLAWYGARVIKIEPPGKGDPLRSWRVLDDDGTSYWWRSHARNKHSVTINLNESAGRDLVSRMLAKADVLVENFRPGKMESWGLGPDQLKLLNPGLVITRVSGYGQDGPYRSRPGFASACEAMAGLRYVNGFADRPPVRPNLSLGDTLAGVHAVIGTLLALYNRDCRLPSSRESGNNNEAQPEAAPRQSPASNGGQVVDVSILESVFNMLEGVVPEYSGAGVVREPSGSTLTGIVPTNTYRCKDGKFIVIGGNGDSIFRRLMEVAGRPDMAGDSRLQTNPGRVEHEAEIDDALLAWTGQHGSAELLQLLDGADVPSAPIYSVADMFEDEHYRARGLFERVHYGSKKNADGADNKGASKAGEIAETSSLEIPALHPRLENTPGSTQWAGPELGEDTEDVLRTLLEMSDKELHQLKASGVI